MSDAQGDGLVSDVRFASGDGPPDAPDSSRKEPPILVSACLAGLATTHSGVAKPNRKVMELVRQGRAILVCPEQLGGLPTPRPAAEIVDGASGGSVLDGEGRVLDTAGGDVTANYLRGAREALKAARPASTFVVLSSSCLGVSLRLGLAIVVSARFPASMVLASSTSSTSVSNGY